MKGLRSHTFHQSRFLSRRIFLKVTDMSVFSKCKWNMQLATYSFIVQINMFLRRRKCFVDDAKGHASNRTHIKKKTCVSLWELSYSKYTYSSKAWTKLGNKWNMMQITWICGTWFLTIAMSFVQWIIGCRKHETIEIQFCIMNNFGVVVGCQMMSNKNSGPEAKPVEHHCTTRFKSHRCSHVRNNLNAMIYQAHTRTWNITI